MTDHSAHQGAGEPAQLTDPDIRELRQGNIAGQWQEIAQMKEWLAQR